jgi:hypothetical protein
MANLKIAEKEDLVKQLSETLKEKLIKPISKNGEVVIHALKDYPNLSHDQFYRALSANRNVSAFYKTTIPMVRQVMVSFTDEVPLDIAVKNIEVAYGKKDSSIIKTLFVHDDEKPVAILFGLSENVMSYMKEGKFSPEKLAGELLGCIKFQSFSEVVKSKSREFNNDYTDFIRAHRDGDEVTIMFPNLASNMTSMRKSYNEETQKLTQELFRNNGFPLEKHGNPDFNEGNLLLKFKNVYSLDKEKFGQFIDTLKQYEGFILERIEGGKQYDFSQFLNKALKITNLEELRQVNGFVLEKNIFESDIQKAVLKQYLENTALKLLEEKYTRAQNKLPESAPAEAGAEIVPLRSLELQKQKTFKGISEDLLKINNNGNLVISSKFTNSLMNHVSVDELVEGLKGHQPAKLQNARG